jgi:hypothetical protein
LAFNKRTMEAQRATAAGASCSPHLIDLQLWSGGMQAPRQTVSVQALRSARFVEGLRMDGNNLPICTRGLYSRFGIETASPTRRVTREHPKIDRIACAWLIRRLIDPNAEFIYVPTSLVLAVAREVGGTPYDIEGVEFSHEDDRCSFDTFLRIYEIKVPALDHLATIVRGADTSRHDLAPQCAGLFSISLGLSANFPNDHEMLEHGMVIYDALYTWCRSLQGRTHNWPAKVTV